MGRRHHSNSPDQSQCVETASGATQEVMLTLLVLQRKGAATAAAPLSLMPKIDYSSYIIPMALSTDSMTAAAITEPT
jgi:hypothetical protein